MDNLNGYSSDSPLLKVELVRKRNNHKTAAGNTYVGELLNSVPNGVGQIWDEQGHEALGFWIGGKLSGLAEISWPHGSLYSGEVDGGLTHGLGTFYLDSCRGQTGAFVRDDITGPILVRNDGAEEILMAVVSKEENRESVYLEVAKRCGKYVHTAVLSEVEDLLNKVENGQKMVFMPVTKLE